MGEEGGQPSSQLKQNLNTTRNIKEHYGKLYGMGSHKVKKLKETVEKELKENGGN